MEVTRLIAWLKMRGAACQSEIDWLEGLPPDTPLRVVWETFPWAIRALEALGADPRRLARIACEIIRGTPLSDGRTVWDLLAERSRKAVEAAERWSRGEEVPEELREIADTATTIAVYVTAKSAAANAAANVAAVVVYPARFKHASAVARAAENAAYADAYAAHPIAHPIAFAAVLADAARAVRAAIDARATARQFAARLAREEFTFEEVEALLGDAM